ncbi:type II toxin-antitoxin system VapC family toxin [Burkholderia ubonensis]|uniref:type II toxin-antitoxin system VapC family toxin n=1 Tax=Burkholderia ubonensis TaxID=101571 RepID=UPI00075B2291|nr:type II toxin-antitoxin system VapC family toxin [Burkholderia ubonensis]KVD24807.1 twitching motility protein PilT [Burkholderia ubonensis]KVP49930.1 twitching motility protein PilT [Burkholderia ubonensis]KVQ98896.1 twitching motility protein PilT [Burkholderia ubonensis]KVX22807.1 twitching motility protein PilT [Burkholderia ubonensis]KWB90019.1 twitching motility protein PilT [Burkholderia ubonensis]
MTKLYMLDTNICSYIMRERPPVVLSRLQSCVGAQHRIVVSAVTYAEMRFGAIGRKASPKHADLVTAFVARLDGVLPWDAAAVDTTTAVRAELAARGTPIGANDASIAGHAIAAGAVLVTHNTREFGRVDGLSFEDWAD